MNLDAIGIFARVSPTPKSGNGKNANVRAGAKCGNDIARAHFADFGGRCPARSKRYCERQLRVAEADDDGIVTGDGALHVSGVHRVSLDNGKPWHGRELGRIAREGRNRMAIR
jgi:hypothetical protein